jgi:hypothetical protein
MNTVVAISPSAQAFTAPSNPTRAIAHFKRVNLKATQVLDVVVPQNCRNVVEFVKVITREADTLTGGAALNIIQYDAALIASRVAASLSTTLTGDNNDLVFTAVAPGTAGNDITVALVDPSGNNQPLGVVVTGTDIVVNLATGAGGAITSTAALVAAAIAASEPAAALVTVANKTGNDGTGVVTALAETALAGGTNPELVQSIVDSVTLAHSGVVADTVQNLTIAATQAVDHGAAVRITITAGATATANTADILVGFIVF